MYGGEDNVSLLQYSTIMAGPTACSQKLQAWWNSDHQPMIIDPGALLLYIHYARAAASAVLHKQGC